jgi:hypothetical protein
VVLLGAQGAVDDVRCVASLPAASTRRRAHHQPLLTSACPTAVPPWLQGPTSSGKTSLVAHLAAQTGHSFVRINNHEHTDLQVPIAGGDTEGFTDGDAGGDTGVTDGDVCLGGVVCALTGAERGGDSC